MTYVSEGRNCELLRVELADGEGVIAEVGKLFYLRGAVEWNVVLPGLTKWILRVSIRERFAPWSLDTARMCGQRAAPASAGTVTATDHHKPARIASTVLACRRLAPKSLGQAGLNGGRLALILAPGELTLALGAVDHKRCHLQRVSVDGFAHVEES